MTRQRGKPPSRRKGSPVHGTRLVKPTQTGQRGRKLTRRTTKRGS